MSSSVFLGLDVGTQGCKAIVYNANENKVVSRGAYNYDILKSDVPGRAEQHPSLWIEVCNWVDGHILVWASAAGRLPKTAVAGELSQVLNLTGRCGCVEASTELGGPQTG